MSTAVCLAVLLGAATPNAGVEFAPAAPQLEVAQIGDRMKAGFADIHHAFERVTKLPPQGIPRWVEQLPQLDLPFSRSGYDHETAFLVRAQSPPYDPGAQASANLNQPAVLPPLDPTGSWLPPQQVWPGTPLLNPNGMAGGTPPQAMMAGVNGPRPFRFGWQSQADIGFLPAADTSPGAGLGDFGVFEFNTELRYTTPTLMQHIFSVAPQFNLRSWSGPGTTGAAGFSSLPGDVYRFGLDLRLTTPTCGPYTLELGFNPALGTDFERGLKSDAWSYDAHGALFVRASPQHLLVLGAMFWDRVEDQVLPYAGIVYTPSQYMEVRALFPKAEINFFIGTPWGVPQWIYVAGEYHIEAYQVAVNTPGLQQNRIQVEDWRALLGIRSECAGMTSFLEGGWVFGRDVEFLNKTTPGFDISSGFIARFGVRY